MDVWKGKIDCDVEIYKVSPPGSFNLSIKMRRCLFVGTEFDTTFRKIFLHLSDKELYVSVGLQPLNRNWHFFYILGQ
jgi:hypothetical protein